VLSVTADTGVIKMKSNKTRINPKDLILDSPFIEDTLFLFRN
jgi:hypothetical protein